MEQESEFKLNNFLGVLAFSIGFLIIYFLVRSEFIGIIQYIYSFLIPIELIPDFIIDVAIFFGLTGVIIEESYQPIQEESSQQESTEPKILETTETIQKVDDLLSKCASCGGKIQFIGNELCQSCEDFAFNMLKKSKKYKINELT